MIVSAKDFAEIKIYCMYCSPTTIHAIVPLLDVTYEPLHHLVKLYSFFPLNTRMWYLFVLQL